MTQVYSVEEEPVPYLVMEFIDGQTLQSKQRKQGPLEIPELLHIGRQIAAGLAAAHEKSLIHRDVKPGNILLEQGVEQKVKITDFGLARAADDASLTRSGMISGTPLYMAPEQALGGTLDGRSDLFSLGSVLYELATGRPPFRAPSTVAVLRRVVDDTPRLMREIIPEIPEWFVTIVNKLLEKKPEDRYQSAKEVADLLARCQSELQLNGEVTCVARAGSVSARSTPAEMVITDRSRIRKHSAESESADRSLTTTAPKPSSRSVLYSLVLGLLMVSPILFGKQVSQFISPLIWGTIPKLPVVERAAGPRFDGKDDFIQVPVHWDSPLLTIEAFVTPDESSPGGTLLQISNERRAGLESIEMFDEPNESHKPHSFVGVTGGPSQGTVSAPLDRGTRQHRAITLDDQYLHYYVNGMWQAKRKVHPEDQQLWKLRQLTIGSQEDRTNFFTGVIDQLRISKVVRYKSNFTPITSVSSDDSTLALYNFDEGTGDTLKDSSGNGNDGRILGATWVAPAKGLQFDGVDDYIDFENLKWSSTQYTFETWITPLAEHGTLFQIAVPQGNLHAYLYQGGTGTGMNRDKPYANVNGPTPGLKRMHLASVFDGQNLNYFVNGKLVGSKTNLSDETKPWQFQRLRIGGKLDPDPSKPEFFHGRMEQFRVSNKALYVLPFTPEERLTAGAETLALYNFDEAQGNLVKDASGHGKDGKIVGAKWADGMPGKTPPTMTARYPELAKAVDTLVRKYELGTPPRTQQLLYLFSQLRDHPERAVEFEQLKAVYPHITMTTVVAALGTTPETYNHIPAFILTQGNGTAFLQVTHLPFRRHFPKDVVDFSPVFIEIPPASKKGDVWVQGVGTGKVFHSPIQVMDTLAHGHYVIAPKALDNLQFSSVTDPAVIASLEKKVADLLGTAPTDLFPESELLDQAVAPADAPARAIAPFDAEQAKRHQTDWAKHLGIPAEFTDKHGMKFVLIPPGEFQMGYSQTELDTLTRELKQAGANEFDQFSAATSGPQHRVRITQPFYMSAHEVTVAQYRSFLEETKYLPTADQLGGKIKWADFIPKENPDPHPAVGVSWTDADSFCVLRSQNGVTYRLPSEAEWEFACRAGSTTLWSFGDTPGQLGEFAATASAGVTQLQPVGTLKPNALGLYDMYGNAEEWCRDWHVQDFYAKSPVDDPVNLATPADSNSGRVSRGGSLSSAVWMTRSSTRRWDYPSTPVSPKGFRVVITGDLKKAVPPSPKVDSDRALAEWVLKHVTGDPKVRLVLESGEAFDVSRRDQLPAAPFYVPYVGVNLEAVDETSIDDALFELMSQCSRLEVISLSAGVPLSRLTDRGFQALSEGPINQSLKAIHLGWNSPSVNPQITDASLIALNRMTHLEQLEIGSDQFTDAGVGQLNLPKLEHLSLYGTRLSPAGFTPIFARSSRLQHLNVMSPKFTGSGLTEVPGWKLKSLRIPFATFSEGDLATLSKCSTLDSLNLGGCRGITVEGIRQMAPNPQLLHLAIHQTALTDESLPDIASKFPSLESLDLGDNVITDAGTQSLAKFIKLKYLNLWQTRVSDSGLEHLASLKSLEMLNIGQCAGITEAGVRKLQAALPDCMIVSDFPDVSTTSSEMPQPTLVESPDFEWSAPVNLGSSINTPARESNPSLTSDELLLVFARDGVFFEARRESRDQPFGQAVKLRGPFANPKPLSACCLSGDGLQLVFSSLALGEDKRDVLLSRRSSRDVPFGEPLRLPAPINSADEDRRPALSPDGLTLALTATRPDQRLGATLLFTRPNSSAEFNSTPTVDPNLQTDWNVITSFSGDGRVLLMTTMSNNVETHTWHTRIGDTNTWSPG